MKAIQLLLISLLLNFLSFGQNCEISYPYEVFEDYEMCLSGLKNSQGEIVLPIEYSFIEVDRKHQVQYHVRSKNGLEGVLDCNLNPVIPIEYQSIRKSFGLDNSWIVQKNDRYGVMNLYGKWQVEPVYDKIFHMNSSGKYFPDSLWHVWQNGKEGIIDVHGGVQVPLEYESLTLTTVDDYKVSLYNRGYSVFTNPKDYIVKKDRLYGVVDHNGKGLIPCEFESIKGYVVSRDYNDFLPSSYFYQATKGKKQTLFDQHGKLLVSGDGNSDFGVHVVHFEEDTVTLMSWVNYKTWKKDSLGKEFQQSQSTITIAGGDDTLHVSGRVAFNHKLGFTIYDETNRSYALFAANLKLLEKGGAYLGPPSNLGHDRFNGLLQRGFNENKKFNILLKEGRLLSKQWHDVIDYTRYNERELYWIQDSTDLKSYQIVNREGEMQLTLNYDSIISGTFFQSSHAPWRGKNNYSTANALLFMQKNGKWGAYNRNLELVIPFEYDVFVEERITRNEPITSYVLEKNGNSGVISYTGEILIPFDYSYAENGFYEDFDLFIQNDFYSLKDNDGIIVIDSADLIFKGLRNIYPECEHIEYETTSSYLFCVKNNHLYALCGDSFIGIEDFTKLKDASNFIHRVLVDKKGDIIYSSSLPFVKEMVKKDFIVANSESKIEVVDRMGNIRFSSDSFQYAGLFENHFVVVDQANRKYILDEDFKSTSFAENYKSVFPVKLFGENYYWVSEELYVPARLKSSTEADTSSWMLFDAEKNEVPIRDRDLPVHISSPSGSNATEDYIIFNSYSHYGLLDKDFNVVIAPEYKTISKNEQLGIYHLEKDGFIQIYDPKTGLSDRKWEYVGLFSLNGYFIAYPEDSDAIAILYWDEKLGLKTISEPDFVEAVLNKESLVEKFGVTKEQKAFIAQYFFGQFVESRKAKNTKWNFENHFILKFLDHSTGGKKLGWKSGWEVRCFYFEPEVSESKKILDYNQNLYLNSSRIQIYSPVNGSYRYNVTETNHNRVFKSLYKAFSQHNLYSLKLNDEIKNYNFGASALPLDLSDLFVDIGAARPHLDSLIREAIKETQMFGTNCPNLDLVVPEMYKNWQFSERGLVFHYREGWTYVSYSKLMPYLKEEYIKAFSKIKREF